MPSWRVGVALGLLLLSTGPAYATIQCIDAGSSRAPANTRAQIYRDVMCQYDPRVPPHSITDVTYAMSIRTVKVVDATLDMRTLAHVWWEDPSLVWDHDTFPIDEIELKSDVIWTPDITTVVTLTWERDDAPQQMLWPATCHVRWNGTVHCISAMHVGGDCSVSTLHWPFLEAACNVYIGLDFRIDSGVKMHFAESQDEREGYVPGNDWVVTEVVREELRDGPLDPNITALTYAIKLRSRGEVQAVALLGPGVVLGTMITSSFSLPIASPIRMGLSCSATLGTVLASSFLFESLPPLEGPTPLVVTSYCSLLVLSGMATLITLALTALLPDHHRAPIPPRWLYGVQDWLLNSKLGKAIISFLLLSPKEKAGEMVEADTTENETANCTEPEVDGGDDVAILTVTRARYGPHKIWDFFSSFLNRCCFFVYLISCFGICMHVAYMLLTYEEPDIDLFEM